MHRSFVFRIHAEEVVRSAVELLLAMAAVFAVEALFTEGTAFTVLTVETLAEGLLEAAFFTVAAEFLAEGTAFPALFAVALEAGTEGLAERTLFAVFTVEALAERLTEGTAFVFAAFFIELAERTLLYLSQPITITYSGSVAKRCGNPCEARESVAICNNRGYSFALPPVCKLPPPCV